ncbi:MAG: hypothetical protein KKA84_03680 [Bacteroidetes bacterium]|nr:hypothetical protein [Bacteroidota bacterium]
MTKSRIYIVISLLLFLSVPWFFTDPIPTEIYGLPSWGFYSLSVTILFAIVTAFLINRYWEKLSDEDIDE